MADRKEWKEQLLSKLLDQYEKSVTYVGENKVKQVFSVKPSDILRATTKIFSRRNSFSRKKNLND